MAAGSPTLRDVAVDRRFTTHDPEFADVLGHAPRLVRVVEADAHEGPVYVAAENALYFTSVPSDGRVAIRRLDVGTSRVTTVRDDTDRANGMALDRDGRSLLVCEQGTFGRPARISRLDPATGRLDTVVDTWRGLPLSSPNDVVVTSDGSVWFTDPSYGYRQGFRPEPCVADAVYRLDPLTGMLAPAAVGFDKPNGLAFSPDERTLYVSDNGAPHELLAFDVAAGRLARRRRLAVGTPEHPDGLKVDAAGRIYASAANGVHVLAPDGRLLGELQLPGTVNFCFGGRGRNVLFVTTDTAIWAAVLAAKGA